MKKGNIIDLESYRQQQAASVNASIKPPAISEELEDAIEDLIQRLKDQGPITQLS